MTHSYLGVFDQLEPPSDLELPLQALWWLKKGRLEVGDEWERAHEICQTAEGEKPFDWVHALVHLIEGDLANANYWYRRAGELQIGVHAAQEWDHLARKLGGDISSGKEPET